MKFIPEPHSPLSKYSHTLVRDTFGRENIASVLHTQAGTCCPLPRDSPPFPAEWRGHTLVTRRPLRPHPGLCGAFVCVRFGRTLRLFTLALMGKFCLILIVFGTRCASWAPLTTSTQVPLYSHPTLSSPMKCSCHHAQLPWGGEVAV